MELRIYDAAMQFKGLIENQTSVLWNRKYFEPGNFELYCPVTLNNQNLLKRGNLVWIKGAAEAGIVESLVIEQDDSKNQITAKGRFLSSYMSRRLIRPFYNFQNGLVETAMREILSNAVPLPLVELGPVKGYTETVSFQATYKNLLDYETKLAKYANIGFRFRPDFSEKKIIFELYKGLDRTFNQTERSRVVFSEKYNNILSAKYTLNDQILKNVCYVGGQGEGSARTIAIAGDDSLTGLERREVFISASDVSKDGLTDAQYIAALEQRGNNELKQDALVESVECTTDANSNFQYLRDYDLGDIVAIRKENWDLLINLRITELTEIYEYGAMKVSPVFGTPLPSVIDWSENNG